MVSATIGQVRISGGTFNLEFGKGRSPWKVQYLSWNLKDAQSLIAGVRIRE